MTTLKPPFTYFGGKTAIAERIVALLPDHKHYVEPFAGSLAVLLAKAPSPMETVNDLNGDLMNFWHVLRDRPADLERVCALTPHSRAEHLLACEAATDDLERARRTWVRITQSRTGTLRAVSTGWRFYVRPAGTLPTPGYLEGYVARMASVAERLHNVSLECRPALDLVTTAAAEPRCLLYLDPPYLGSTRNGTNYGHEMESEQDHRDLAAALSGAQASVVLSGYASPLYEGLYDGWYRAEIHTRTGQTDRCDERTEVVWSNRPFPQGHLFDLEAS